MVELQYIYHSGFLLKAQGCCSVVFDYWKDGICEEDSKSNLRYDRQSIPDFVTDSVPGLPMFVVVSHHHKDHFNPSIFRWLEKRHDIHFILSKDTSRFAKHYLSELPEDSYTVLGPGQSYSSDGFTIKAFPSTDIGNSYVATLALPGQEERKFNVFHAGDLNNWLWLDESTPGEIRKMDGDFKAALRQIAADFPHVDIAMFPVDSRLGRGYGRGASEFLRTIETDRFFPMHFGLGENAAELRQRERDARNFALYGLPDRGEYIALQSPGDTWAGFPVSR